jgi:hypothetical protein
VPRQAALVCGISAGLSVLICAPLFVQPNGVGHFDWDQHLFYYASVLKSVIEYGQWPFWNPWYCGGNVLWQNPQVALLSPTYPLALLFSLPLAMKLNVVLHYWIGFVGMHLLLRQVAGVRFLPLATYLSCVFVASGALALHVAEGHTVFLPAFYLPLLLFWLCRAMSGGGLRDALFAGGVLGLMVFNGGLHTVPMAVIGIGTLALTAAAVRRRWQPVLVALVCGVAGFAYAAPKLVPVLTYLESDRFQDDRALGVPDTPTVEMVAHAYLDPSQNRRTRFPSELYPWQEYGNYIGVPAALLIVGALLWVFFSTGPSTTRWLGVSLAVTAALFFAFSLGEFSQLAPASLARVVPFLSKYRLPSRYTMGFVLFATTLVGWTLRELSFDTVSSRGGRILVAALCLSASGDLIWRNGAHFNGIFDQRPLESGFQLLRRPQQPITDTSIDAYKQDAPMLRALMANRSTFNCYEPLKLAQIADPDKPLVFGETGVRLMDSVFTPNRIVVRIVGGPQTSRLFVNQSYAPGWRSTLGEVTIDPAYRNIAVTVPAGATGRFSFTFSPPGFLSGWIIFALAILASILVLQNAVAAGLSRPPNVRLKADATADEKPRERR